MSSIKRKLEIDKIKHLIFEMLNEQLSTAVPFDGDSGDGTAPNPEPHETRVEREIRQREERLQNFNAAAIEKFKNHVPEGVNNDIVAFEKKIKNFVILEAYRDFLASLNYYNRQLGLSPYAGVSSILSSSREFTDFVDTTQNGLDYFETILRFILKSNKIENIPMAIAIEIIFKISNTFKINLVQNNSSKLGGPFGNFSINLGYNNKDYMSLLEDDSTIPEFTNLLSNVINNSSINQTKYSQRVLSRSDSWLTEANNESWTSLIKYVFREMTVQSDDNELSPNGILLSFLNSVTTGDILTIKRDSEVFQDPSASKASKQITTWTYSSWVLSDYLTNILQLGYGAASVATIANPSAGFVTILKVAARRVFWVYVCLAVIQIILAGSSIAIEARKLSQKAESIEKILKTINSDCLSKILDPVFIKNVIDNNFEGVSAIKDQVANIVEEVYSGIMSELGDVGNRYTSLKEKRQEEINKLLYSPAQQARPAKFRSANASTINQYNPGRFDVGYRSKIDKNDRFTPGDADILTSDLLSKDVFDMGHETIVTNILLGYTSTFVVDNINEIMVQSKAISGINTSVSNSVYKITDAINTKNLSPISAEVYNEWEENSIKEMHGVIYNDGKSVSVIKDNNKFKINTVKKEESNE